MKELANKFEGRFEYLGGNIEKYKTFSIPIEKEFILLIMQDLWQVHYQIFWIISQKEFIKIKCKDCDCFLEYESVKDNLIKFF